MAREAKILGKKLAEARKALFLTQRELGQKVNGLSDETISRIERHEIAGTLAKHLPKFAAALGMTLEQFKLTVCPPDAKSTAPPRAEFPAGLNLRRLHLARVVPEFQIGIAASRRVDKIAEHPDANRPIATTDRRAFVAPVDGDCQSPKWKHGEIVVFSYDAAEREGIIAGKSYYVAFTDGSTTFKRVFPDESDPNKIVLRCWNQKKYPFEQKVHRDEISGIARAVSKQVAVEEEE